MRNHTMKRLLSLLLVAAMTFSTRSVAVFAKEADGTQVSAVQENQSVENIDTGDIFETVDKNDAAEKLENQADAENQEFGTIPVQEDQGLENTDTDDVPETADKDDATDELENQVDTKQQESTDSVPAKEEISEDELPEDGGISLLSVDGFVSETHDVFSRTASTIAPGVTQEINYAYSKDGKQMVYYVATADITRSDVNVYANYKDNQCTTPGMDKLTAQMASAQAKHSNPEDPENYVEYYNVVAGINADFYNMTNGWPEGAFAMEGNVVKDAVAGTTFFAILDDGTAVIGSGVDEWNTYKDRVMEAVGGSTLLVKNGVDNTNVNDTTRHSRTCVGITADGKVVMMVLDGRQEPFSCGGSMHELAQIMLEAGCVSAINLDGGGSTTFAAKQEGENHVSIVNRPSDGSERSISDSLMIVSTAVTSDTFDHVVLTAEHDYVTPGSAVKVSAFGVSPAGTFAEIPENVNWSATSGSIEDGIFVSDGTSGDAVVQMLLDDAVVGETTIHVVIPENVRFNHSEITVPYGKTIPLELTATYGLNEVTVKPDDFIFELSDETIGSLDGLEFTATEDAAAATESQITATLVLDGNISADAIIRLGKGSEVIWDFEDGTTNEFGLGYKGYNYYLPNSNVSVVSAENGRVHNGNYALALNIDYSNSLESGYQMISLYQLDKDVLIENAKTIGMWIYIPDECVGLWARWQTWPVTGTDEDGNYEYGSLITGEKMDNTAGGTGVVYSFEESGWHYLSMDVSKYPLLEISKGDYFVQFYISDRDGAAYNYYFKDQHNVNGNFTFYIDDITVDYSSAIDDREAPVFDSLTYATTSMSDAAALVKGTVPIVSGNEISFDAKVSENTKKTNATGIDATTAKAYVDGNEIACTYSNDIITMNNSVTLADGVHTVKFSICDRQGNYASIIRQINVQTGSGKPTIKVVPHDSTLNRIPLGSVYYVDVIATDIEKVQSVTTVLDLDSMSQWELEHMEVAEGFAATYSIQADENIATLTIIRNGICNMTGEAALVSLPVRAWTLKNSDKQNPLSDKEWTLAQFVAGKEFWPIYVDVKVDRGTVTFTDGTADFFAGEGIETPTEMWANYSNMVATAEGKEYYANWNGGHTHTVEPAEDKAATCTEDGYTGRTICNECSSVINWGTTVPAVGHAYDLVEGVLKCTVCGELFNGEWTDGKFYVDGVVASEGWVGDYYYVNGEKLTGIQQVDGYYYNFGEDGVCGGKTKYTGMVEADGGLCYAKIGELVTGWVLIGQDNYYFGEDYMAVSGADVNIDGYVYSFDDNGVLVKGAWVTNSVGTMYLWAGSAVHAQFMEIEGKTYVFNASGYVLKGDQYIKLTHGDVPYMYYISDDGVINGKMEGFTGLHTSIAGTFYVEDGVAVYAGLVQDSEGNYYYINSALKAVQNCTYTIGAAKTNGLLPAGTYEFDADGRMINPPSDGDPDGNVKNGLIIDDDGELRYYVNGEATYAGLVQDADGNYYYINSAKKAVKSCTYGIGTTRTNGLLPAGTYEFGADGRMINPPSDKDPDGNEKNGLVTDNDGELRYYVDGEATYAGLVQDTEGHYYYINSTLKAVKSCMYTIGTAKTNGLLPAGTYEFGADGRMINPPSTENPDGNIKNGLIIDDDGEIRYYTDGQATYAGLIQDADGDYYYINSSKKAVKNCTYGIGTARTNGLLPAGTYEFGVDGKMVNPPA